MMSSFLIDAVKLKDLGNKAFATGKYAESAQLYGQCLEAAIVVESTRKLTSADDKGLMELKPTIFLNLAAANMKLQAWDGARRLCNVALIFCNTPYLPLDDLGVTDDINIDTETFEPILPERKGVVVKALYRRGQCYLELGHAEKALMDFNHAISLSPEEKSLHSAKLKAEAAVADLNAISKDAVESQLEPISPGRIEEAELAGMTINGGSCFSRKGYWTQTVSDVKIFLPLRLFGEFSASRSAQDKKLKIEFLRMEISVSYESILCLELEYIIKPAECTWMLEYIAEGMKQSSGPKRPNYLVLHLTKAPSIEWFPGCEWWDRVFVDDEPIDTLTCSIGTDVSDLPDAARERAEKEHVRFASLPSMQQVEEAEGLAKLIKQARAGCAETDSEAGTLSGTGGRGGTSTEIDSLSVSASHTTDFAVTSGGRLTAGSLLGSVAEGGDSVVGDSYIGGDSLSVIESVSGSVAGSTYGRDPGGGVGGDGASVIESVAGSVLDPLMEGSNEELGAPGSEALPLSAASKPCPEGPVGPVGPMRPMGQADAALRAAPPLTAAALEEFESRAAVGDEPGALDDEVLDALRQQFPHIEFKVREI